MSERTVKAHRRANEEITAASVQYSLGAIDQHKADARIYAATNVLEPRTKRARHSRRMAARRKKLESVK